MNIFPLKQISLQHWKKKVDCTSMYTIPAEDDALPVLQQLDEILTRLMTIPLQQTIHESHVEYFFTNVFPPVCQKIIRSRYFKNPQVLKLSNSILQKSVYLTTQYLDIAIKFPKFLEVLTIVFSDEYYFKTNNQMTYMIYPYSYFPQLGNKMTFQVGDIVDVLKTGTLYEKVSWSQGQIVQVDELEVQVAYLFDGMDKKIRLKKDSPQLAPLNTKSHTFQWRKNLKCGDLVDVEDSFGTWYNGTVIQIIERGQGKKNVKVTLKVYNQMGNKTDQNGLPYYGFSDYQQTIDFTSPKIAPFCSISKQFCYESNKVSSYDSVEDINDYEFLQINGTKIYALPRKKNLSEFQFQTINGFGQLGGFDKYIEYLQKQTNFDVFSYFIKGISGVTPYLHRKVVRDTTQTLKVLFERYFFNQQTAKQYTKQQSQMAFSGLKVLQKRIYSTDNVSKFQNNLKMRLAEVCLQSQTIKSKLQGLNELKDIVRSVTYVSQKNRYIKDWVKNNKIFQKIYITNSHVQLIKKSQQFFKYLITQNILEVNDLQRLYKIAQKGDFESRVSLYKLFQEVSHIFKKDHVDFLIDTILESDVNLILNQDIDLLHELARFSNYFPLEKVINFFESLILGDSKVKQINDYAIKKYSQMVAKNQDVKKIRNSIIKKFLQKLTTHDILQITKVLKGIFQGIGTGQWGKKDLNQILTEEKFDEILVQALKKFKDKPQFGKNLTIILDFLLFIYKISYRTKINIKILVSIWNQLQGDEEKQRQFYRWANEVLKCEQGFENASSQQLEQFYRKLFSSDKLPQMQGSQMQLAKNFFVEINKKAKYITVSNSFKDREIQKQYKRKVDMKSLKLIDILIQMIYQVKSETINNQIFTFFIELYTSKDNSQQQIDQLLSKLLKDFKQQYQAKNYKMLSQTIKLLQVVINDSQKNVETNIKSLLSKKQPDYAKFIIMNQVSYVSSDNYKKTDMVFAMNTPVIKLRKIMAKQFNLSWQQVKIVSHKQIEDYDNSRTLKEIKLNPNQPLTVSRRIIFSSSQQQLILNDQMNPKAIRCFKIIFEKYSTDGKMDKNQCNSFTAMCLGSSCSAKYYNQKISSLYSKYDDDNDGLLTFDNFLKFYEDAAKDRPSTVMSNLKSFGVRGDFKFSNEPEDDVQVTKFPRNVISEEPKVYDMLFDLLHVKEVASAAFELLERLPVSKAIQQQLLNIQSAEDLSKNLSTPDLYELFYKLNIIEYLAHSNELETQAQKQFHSKFIQFQGYEQLYDCLKKLVSNQNKQSEENKSEQLDDIIRQISETSLNLLNQYWVECFSRDPTKIRLSLTFISADEDIDDKMDYLTFGRFFKSERKLQPKPSKMPAVKKLYLWKGKPKSQISDFIAKQLSNRWTQICNTNKSSESSQKFYSITMLINKLIDSVNILSMNEDPHKIIHDISNLLDSIPSTDLIRRLYCLILSQCFYVTQGKYQGVYIRQLFKNLTKGSITSEHFRVLAVLVSRFGIMNSEEGDQSEESTQKLKQVLLQNVLNNNNQLTVQGCAKLLTNFYLQNTPYEVFEKIWDERLFNPSTICQKQQSKAALYELILKLCDNNPQIVNQIIKKVLTTLQEQIKNMKIVYCSEYKQRSATGYAGLKNLGSTCYINSMIQQLFMNKTFRYCILRADDGEKENQIQVIGNKDEIRTVDDNFLHQLQRIFAYLQGTNRIDFAPRDFCVAYKPFGQSVNVLIQQDVQQFVSMFFDRLEAGLSKTLFKKLVEDFYSGKTTNLFQCHSCQKAKKVEQNFHCISLQVKTSKTLAQSFNRFGLGEMISDYKCDFCEKKVDVTKKTRISKAPKILIIHLQRIVFNYDTFINQKITTKHTFPNNFNLYESTLDYLENKDKANATDEPPKQYEYSLIGIICHSGTAESGHYISYIKTADNKWIQFNDSQVTPFNASNIESECFGGYYSSNTFDDDYFEEKKESSKSAYLLIYERQGANTVQLVLNSQIQSCKTEAQRQKVKQQMLQALDFKQVINRVNKKVENSQANKSGNEKASQNQNTDNATQNVSESHQESSSAPQDSQKQTKQLLEQKQIQIKRHQSQDNIQTEIKDKVQSVEEKKPEPQKVQQANKNKEVIVYIQDPLTPYMPPALKQQITKDNQIHYFEKCLSSTGFAKFFSQLISKPNDLYDSILPLCQKLTFGFWLKSQGFKDLLSMLDGILKIYPAGFESVVTNNPAIISLLIESSDADIRTSMANFLAKVIADTIAAKNINIYDHPEDPIFKFLDKLLALLPSTVSKCWTKFGQYFEFWYELSNKGETLVEYMSNREIIKHFMDYFLDTKSPLKIYSVKRQHPIGSSYANPNFSMLLKCVFSLLQQRMVYNEKNKNSNKLLTSSPQQQILLMSHESLEKLISQNYENVAAQLVKQICPNNLAASEKAAIVLLKGISKSNSQTIQPYLQVVHQFVLIEDQYQDLRIKWVIGKQTLAVSPMSQKIVALHAYSIDERLHNYDSSIFVESGSSLLQPILAYCKRIQTFAMLLTKQLFKLCDESKKIRNYIFSLQSPTLTTSKYVDFFKGFIDKYYDDHKKSYGFYSSSPGFNRQEFGKYVKQLYEKVIKKVEEDQLEEKLQQSKKEAQQKKAQLKNQQQANKQLNNKQNTKQDENEDNKQQQKQAKDKTQKPDKEDKQNKEDKQQQKTEVQTVEQEQNVDNLVSQATKKQKNNKGQASKFEQQAMQRPQLYSYDDDDDWTKVPSTSTNPKKRKDSQDEDEYPKRGNRKNNRNSNFVDPEYSIKVHEQKYDTFAQAQGFMAEEIAYSDEQIQQPLVKTKQTTANEKEPIKDYKQAWHPVKFDYVPVRVLPPNDKLPGLKIEEHESIVTYVLTKPTGYTNRSFTSTSGVHKTSQRMLPETWDTQKQVKVHGFFVTNSGRNSVRIQTNDGCAFCKSVESMFIWADEIVRVWESEKSIDWPKWRLSTNDNKEAK